MANTIVVGVDGTADSLSALTSAARLATDSGARLVVLYVRNETPLAAAGGFEASAESALEEALDETERISREKATAVMATRTVDWKFAVSAGDPASELIAAAAANDAKAIVVGGRSHGVVGGLVLGSVAQKLVRHSPISVLVVRDGKPQPLERVATPSGA